MYREAAGVRVCMWASGFRVGCPCVCARERGERAPLAGAINIIHHRLNIPPGSSRLTPSVGRDTKGAFVCADAAVMGKALVLWALGRGAMACEVRAASTVRVRKIEGALATRTAAEHLRIGAH